MIVTIDGPAGAGKSSIAREVAQQLGFRFLDTGAMYRAAVVSAIRAEVEWEDTPELVKVATTATIGFEGDRVILDGDDVSGEIRQPHIGRVIHYVADNPMIRKRMVQLQRLEAEKCDTITEGRDQGTVAFPKADCKIYLTASAEERARRRFMQLQESGDTTTLEEVLQDQIYRDTRDRSRPFGALSKARDAVEVVTDGMTKEQVVFELVQVIEGCRKV